MATPQADPGPDDQPVRRRAQLDRDVIIQAVLELSAHGKPLTFRALGTALGADPTAMYRHFRDKDELVRGAFDRMLTEVSSRIDHTASWREQLRQSAVATMEICEKYPSIGAEALALTTHGPGELTAVEHLLQQFLRAGLDQAAAVRFYAAYSSYLLAASATSASLVLAPRLDRTASPEEREWIGDMGRVDAALYPAVASARSELAQLQDRDVFMMGVDVLLDAAAAAGAKA